MSRGRSCLFEIAHAAVFVISIAASAIVFSPLSAAQTTAASQTASKFPPQLVDWVAGPDNPVFAAEGPGHWDVKIRERGWILREGESWHLWFTGYDGTSEGTRLLGYATSADGVHWMRWPQNPLVRDHWVEDMMVVKEGDTYYMFAEGLNDLAQLLTSKDRVHWNREGTLDIRYTNGKPLTPGPFGTPTAWNENGTWYLFYERMDKGIWIATSKDPKLKVWTNVQDEPVIVPGPDAYDSEMIAMNQVIKHEGAYYAILHGSGRKGLRRTWTTNIARSTNLVHWQKYDRNPIVPGDTSSGIIVSDGRQLRLYTMHERVEVYFPKRSAD